MIRSRESENSRMTAPRATPLRKFTLDDTSHCDAPHRQVRLCTAPLRPVTLRSTWLGSTAQRNVAPLGASHRPVILHGASRRVTARHDAAFRFAPLRFAARLKSRRHAVPRLIARPRTSTPRLASSLGSAHRNTAPRFSPHRAARPVGALLRNAARHLASHRRTSQGINR